MVSGFKISPYDLAKIISGEASPIVIDSYFLDNSIFADCM
ncbi:uncharacterized protein METZ01_LOCUS132199 [marine metagenome]|jgi:hypothetical protein|uniref:Uncharacterized protein n=1 Tax=marine metagenome TaxID=408172 RepID=A0A381YQR7_9ZZZZ